MQHKAAGRVVTLVQINCSHQGLESLFKNGLPVVAAGFHLAFAKRQVSAQGDAARRPSQAGTADQGRAPLGQLALGNVGQVAVKLGGDYQFEHGIAKKFHTLVGIQG